MYVSTCTLASLCVYIPLHMQTTTFDVYIHICMYILYTTSEAVQMSAWSDTDHLYYIPVCSSTGHTLTYINADSAYKQTRPVMRLPFVT